MRLLRTLPRLKAHQGIRRIARAIGDVEVDAASDTGVDLLNIDTFLSITSPAIGKAVDIDSKIRKISPAIRNRPMKTFVSGIIIVETERLSVAILRYRCPIVNHRWMHVRKIRTR